MDPVPEFFQSETTDARREQLAWLKTHLGLDDEFFGKVLKVDQSSVVAWQVTAAPIEKKPSEQLGRLWNMFLHLLAFSGFDYAHARELLHAKAGPHRSLAEPGLTVPWPGKSMRSFLENRGSKGIDEVNAWVTSFRFSNRYASQRRRAGSAAASAVHRRFAG